MTTGQRADVEEGEGLVALEELHRRNLACGVGPALAAMSRGELLLMRVPLMILQKMQAAILWKFCFIWSTSGWLRQGQEGEEVKLGC